MPKRETSTESIEDVRDELQKWAKRANRLDTRVRELTDQLDSKEAEVIELNDKLEPYQELESVLVGEVREAVDGAKRVMRKYQIAHETLKAERDDALRKSGQDPESFRQENAELRRPIFLVVRTQRGETRYHELGKSEITAVTLDPALRGKWLEDMMDLNDSTPDADRVYRKTTHGIYASELSKPQTTFLLATDRSKRNLHAFAVLGERAGKCRVKNVIDDPKLRSGLIYAEPKSMFQLKMMCVSNDLAKGIHLDNGQQIYGDALMVRKIITACTRINSMRGVLTVLPGPHKNLADLFLENGFNEVEGDTESPLDEVVVATDKVQVSVTPLYEVAKH
jgi:hypothetical protein